MAEEEASREQNIHPCNVGALENDGTPQATQIQSCRTQFKFLIEGEVYTALHRHFLMQGKGRRPQLPPTDKMTNGLLLQLFFLKEEAHASYKEVRTWLQKLIPSTGGVSESQICHRVNTIFDLCSQLPDDEVRSAHLSTCSPNVEVSTPRALIDDKVKITVHGLEKGQQVTLQAYLKEAGKTYGACGQYVASNKGIVDTWTDVSHGGTFEGVEPMGLFWSMKTVPGVKPGRLIKADVMVPYEVTVAVQNGFKKFEDLQWSNTVSSLASCCLERTYSGPGIKRIPVKENGLYGTLFLPPGEGPFPAVIDLFGLTGGIIETRSALLASQGVASFSVAYVDHEDLPKIDTSLDFHYFLKAFDWLASQPQVDPNSLGGIATCVGGGYLQLIGFMRPAMKCLVIINGTGCPFGLDQVVEGEHISPLQFRYDRISFVDGMASFRNLFQPEDRKKFCQSWRHGAKHLWIHGLDDQCVHPVAMEGFKASVPEDFKKNFTFVTFPGAGHLIEPPYAPLCRFNYNAIFKKNMLWGGEPILHAKAQERSWSLIQAFIEENLRRS